MTITGLPPRRQLLTGWGRTAPSAAQVVRPRSARELADRLAAAPPRGALARGLGRSYGDAAQNGGGLVLDTTALDSIWIDTEAATARVQAGVSLDSLLRVSVPKGLFVAVTPGTRQVTVGGAIGSDVHGKNHHRDGGFAQHVESLELATSDGRLLRLGPGDEAFWATAGGMGLTGVVTEATLRLMPIRSSRVRVLTMRAPDLDSCLALMSERDADHRFSVAWIDLMASGAALGRSVITWGDFAEPDELDGDGDPLAYSARTLLRTPAWMPPGLLNRVSIRAFNEAYYRHAPREGVSLEPIGRFFHPLDIITNWNRGYGPGGLIQYQFVVPFEATDALRAAVRLLSEQGVPSFLSVLKRFGDQPGMLSFPRPGWTLALDVPGAWPGLAALFGRLDELVLEAGGRLYLSKDSRMRPDALAAMYPQLRQWRTVRDALDPERRMVSDLARRLHLLDD